MGKRLKIPENYGAIEIKKDCQMWKNPKNNKEGECDGLNSLFCKWNICRFYKKKKVE